MAQRLSSSTLVMWSSGISRGTKSKNEGETVANEGYTKFYLLRLKSFFLNFTIKVLNNLRLRRFALVIVYWDAINGHAKC